MKHFPRLLLLIIFVWGVVTCVPWRASSLELDADSAWQFQLSETWQNGAVFGRDIVWTYGPWGFALLRQAHPHTFWLMIATRGALVLVALVGTLVTVRRLTSRDWPPIVAVFFVVCSLSLTDNSDYLGFLTAVLVAMLGADLISAADTKRGTNDASASGAGHAPVPIPDLICLHAMAVSGGLFAVAKFTLFPIFGTIFLSLAIAASWIDRRVAAAAGTYLLSATLLWLAAGQPLSAMADYVAVSFEISRSFTEGMGAPMRLPHVFLFGGVLLVSLALYSATLGDSIRRPWAWMHLAAFTGVLFVIFKSACVRHQGVNCFMILIALPAIICLRQFPNNSRALRLAAIGTAVLGLITAELVARQRIEGSAIGVLTTNLVSPGRPLRAVWVALTDPDSIRRRHEEAMSRVRSHFAAVPLRGSVDIFPYDNPVPAVLGLAYRPRPVLQSYQACSVRLNAIDAAFFESSRAPDWVLYRIPTSNGEPKLIDDRYPTLEEPVVVESLLRNYTPLSVLPPAYTVLRRTPGARDIAVTSQIRESVRLGDWLELPNEISSKRVRCRIAFAHSTSGKLVGFLWQYPVMRLQIRLADDSVHDFRLTQELAQSGFILSPLPRSSVDLFGLIEDDWAVALDSRRVKAIRVVPAQGRADAWAFADNVGVECETLRFVNRAGRFQPADSQPATKPGAH